METLTDKFQAALIGGHQTTCRVEILPGGDETQRIDLSDYLTDGSIDVSRQQIRRSGSLTFVDRDASGLIVPTGQDSLLAPYGNQVRVYAGIDFDDGSEELVCVGTFRITKSVSKYPMCTVDISDRAWIVANGKLVKPYQVANSTPWDQAVTTLLGNVYPGCPTDIPSLEFDTTTPRITLDEQADPWDAMQSWMSALGYALYFDPFGVATVAYEVALATADPVWTYDGTSTAAAPYDPNDWANLALYDESLTWDSDGAFNAVIITGTSSSNSTGFRGEAYDTDPHSPTRWTGPFGQKPLFENSELVTSNGQALRTAQGRLQQVAGLAESLSIPAVPNPALEVGDMIHVLRPELGIDTAHMLDRIPIPLRGGVQTLETRVRRVVVSGDS